MSSFVEPLIGMLPVKWQNSGRQFLRFGVTGAIGAIIDFSIYTFLTRGLGWNHLYTVFGYPISAANNVSVFIVIVSNFFLNKYWTFKNRQGSATKQWVGYFALNTVTWALNQILMSFFAFNVPLFAVVFGNLKDLAAKAAAIGIIMFINFFGSKFLVFRRK